MGRRLIALDMTPGPRFVERLVSAWDDGDAIFPVDQRLPPASRDRLLHRLRPHRVCTDADETDWAGTSAEVAEGDAAVIATSGSTGEPKGVVLTHDAIAASATASDERLGATGADHWLACLPLSHVGGLSVIFRALHRSTSLTVLPRFDPAEVTAAAHNGANLVSLVATAMGRIDTDLFDTILLGGSIPPSDRPTNSVTTYGMTETGSGVVYDRVPLNGVEVRVVDGEVEVRGPMLLRCYRGGDPFEWSPLDDEGWFATGDLGEIEADGRLRIFGRHGDLIISGGENVWPAVVEEVIATMDDVVDVIVAGTDDAEWGQLVTAHVVLGSESQLELAAVRETVKAVLPPYCAPRRLVIHEALPRTSLGKPQRHKL